jgi:hypothetical protein
LGESGSTPISRSTMAAFLTGACTGLHIPYDLLIDPVSQYLVGILTPKPHSAPVCLI